MFQKVLGRYPEEKTPKRLINELKGYWFDASAFQTVNFQRQCDSPFRYANVARFWAGRRVTNTRSVSLSIFVATWQFVARAERQTQWLVVRRQGRFDASWPRRQKSATSECFVRRAMSCEMSCPCVGSLVLTIRKTVPPTFDEKNGRVAHNHNVVYGILKVIWTKGENNGKYA